MLSVVIPAYNGRELLGAHLPPLLDLLDKENINYEVIVVDDGSTEEIKLNYQKTQVFRLAQNSGFTAACNFGARQCNYSKILFLNTDVKVTPGFIPPLLEHFKDGKVFAVAPKILIPDESNYDEAVTAGRLRGSHLILKIGSRTPPHQATEILYACGAALLVDRDKFWELGGFDELYKPFYGEDLDLCYQAWKRGYRVIYEPKSIVYHLHSKTIKTFQRKTNIQSIAICNQYLFRWKNFTDPWLVFLMILELFTLKLINPNPTEWRGYFKALRKLPAVLKKRKEIKRFAKLSDAQIFAKFRNIL